MFLANHLVVGIPHALLYLAAMPVIVAIVARYSYRFIERPLMRAGFVRPIRAVSEAASPR